MRKNLNRTRTQVRVALTLPELHEAQQVVAECSSRFRVLPCGRRWGKTTFGIDQAVHPMLKGYPVGWFAPTYKILADAWREFKRVLAPAIASKRETDHRIELITKGSLDMWTLEKPDAGRGRKYKRIIIDEAGLAANLEESWTEAVRPTLTDLEGDALFLGTPKGRNYFWRMFCFAEDPEERDWAGWRMPTSANPYIPPREIEAARLGLPERAYRQEYLAEFIHESGGVFRKVLESVDKDRTEVEPYEREGVYTLGVDLARTEDFTVIVVMNSLGRQVYFERFNQISWQRQVQAIQTVATKYRGCRVIVDSTGVGDPIFEELTRLGLEVEGYHMSAVSKPQLIDALAMDIENDRIRLMDIGVQTAELLAYEYEVTRTGYVRTSAPPGMHDDCVIALALANKRRLRSAFDASLILGAGKLEAYGL